MAHVQIGLNGQFKCSYYGIACFKRSIVWIQNDISN